MEKSKINAGDKFGKLTVLNSVHEKGRLKYRCMCECGNECVVWCDSLKYKKKESCGCSGRKSYYTGENYIGKKYGKLTIVEILTERKNSRVFCKCLCDCGKEHIVAVGSVTAGGSKSCGCGRIGRPFDVTSIIGTRFGRLVVRERIGGNEARGQSRYLCSCDCGKETTLLGSALRSGKTKSCGCLRNESIEMIGKRFGMLLVVSVAERKEGNGALYYECICDCGNKIVTRGRALRTGHAQSCGCQKYKTESVIGERFGRFIVVARADGRARHKRLLYNCLCDCGESFVAIGGDIKQGNIISCGCAKKFKNREYAIMKKLYNRAIVHTSKKMKIETDITIDDYILMITKPCHYCGVTGYNHADDRSHTSYQKISRVEIDYNGVDRVDSSGGYTKDNVVTCCRQCNTAKNNMTLADFKEWIMKVYRYRLGDVEAQKASDENNLTDVRLRVKGRRHIDRRFSIVKNLYDNQIVGSSKNRGIECSINVYDYWNIIRQPCCYCGVTSSMTQGDKRDAHGNRISDTVIFYNGVDRIDNEKGYIKGNITPCCWRCNCAKWTHSQKDFIDWVERVYKTFIEHDDTVDRE